MKRRGFEMPFESKNRSQFAEISGSPEQYFQVSEDWLKKYPNGGIQPVRRPEKTGDELASKSESKDSE